MNAEGAANGEFHEVSALRASRDEEVFSFHALTDVTTECRRYRAKDLHRKLDFFVSS